MARTVLLDGGTALRGRPGVPALRRSFHPDDLLPQLKAAGVDYTITVEAADGPAENKALLANARVHAWIAGVVGWLPKLSAGKFHSEPPFTSFDHLVGAREQPQRG